MLFAEWFRLFLKCNESSRLWFINSLKTLFIWQKYKEVFLVLPLNNFTVFCHVYHWVTSPLILTTRFWSGIFVHGYTLSIGVRFEPVSQWDRLIIKTSPVLWALMRPLYHHSWFYNFCKNKRLMFYFPFAFGEPDDHFSTLHCTFVIKDSMDGF